MSQLFLMAGKTIPHTYISEILLKMGDIKSDSSRTRRKTKSFKTYFIIIYSWRRSQEVIK